LLVVAAAAACAWTFIEPGRALPVAIAVLVVSCPCALSLATPAALAAAAGALARLRVLCVRPNALETLARVTHVVFDKTGTLTTGELKLVRIDAFADDEARQLARAIALEQGSTHPLARVLAAQMPAERVVAHDIVAVPGCGVEGTIGRERYRLGRPAWALPTAPAPKRCAPGAAEIVVALADATRVLATFRFGDELRTDMPALIASLRDAGIGASIVSGDDPANVADVAGKVGIADHRGAASPEDKQAYIAALQARGEVVAMVGDGVNDAPGLARADVSIAFGNAATLAQWTADVVVPGADAQRIARALAIARRTFRIVRENLAWALVYNAVAIPLAAIGWLTPLAAAAGMTASSLAVVSNAWRLRSVRG
jgi:Cu2+-exporting ATPase